MEGKEAIIEKILQDAKSGAEEMIKNATDYANERVSEAEEWVKNYNSEQEKILKSDAEEIVKRRKIVAGLDARKTALKYKRELIDNVFSKVYEKLCKVSKKEYLCLVEKLLSENAEKSETVVLSCDGVISIQDIQAVEVVKRLGLSVAEKHGNFKGGVQLLGKESFKDLSFKAVVEDYKNKATKQVAEKLF